MSDREPEGECLVIIFKRLHDEYEEAGDIIYPEGCPKDGCRLNMLQFMEIATRAGNVLMLNRVEIEPVAGCALEGLF